MEEMREQGLKCKRHRAGPREDRSVGSWVTVRRRMFRKELDHWQPGLETSGRDLNRRHGIRKWKRFSSDWSSYQEE